MTQLQKLAAAVDAAKLARVQAENEHQRILNAYGIENRTANTSTDMDVSAAAAARAAALQTTVRAQDVRIREAQHAEALAVAALHQGNVIADGLRRQLATAEAARLGEQAALNIAEQAAERARERYAAFVFACENLRARVDAYAGSNPTQ